MSKPRVLITARSIGPGHPIEPLLQEAGIEPVFNRPQGEDEMVAAIRGMDAIICSSDPLSARVIEAADRLKVISRTGVGFNTIDVKAATARRITVCTQPGANRHAVTELAFGLLLSCARKFRENVAEVEKGGWSTHEGVELAGKTLGIVGLGTIGKEMAQRARAFEMRLLAYDMFQDPQFAEAYQVEYVSLEQLLRESDFVTIHVFLDARSHHLINAERLALMKPTAYLVNTARGGVVDSEALHQAIKEGRLAGAGLDVHEQEPLGESPLRGLPNVYLTPHAGAATAEFRKRSYLQAAEAVIKVMRGERPTYVLNPDIYR